jgi:hypothetical protein
MSVQRFRKGVEKGEGRRREDEEGHLRLTHDEEAQAFYTPDGELALSHDRVDLRHLFSGMREPEGEVARMDAQIENLSELGATPF